MCSLCMYCTYFLLRPKGEIESHLTDDVILTFHSIGSGFEQQNVAPKWFEFISNTKYCENRIGQSIDYGCSRFGNNCVPNDTKWWIWKSLGRDDSIVKRDLYYFTSAPDQVPNLSPSPGSGKSYCEVVTHCRFHNVFLVHEFRQLNVNQRIDWMNENTMTSISMSGNYTENPATKISERLFCVADETRPNRLQSNSLIYNFNET